MQRNLCKAFRSKNISDLHNSPLWHNSALSLQFRSNWSPKKGYTLVKDILDAKGFLYTLNGLHDMNLKINYLDYETYETMKLTTKIEIYNRETIRTTCPDIPLIVDKMGLSSIGCSNTYTIISADDNFILENIRTKWSTVLNDDILLYKVEKTFVSLRKIPSCAYCNTPSETMLHASINCSNVKDFWKDIEVWL